MHTLWTHDPILKLSAAPEMHFKNILMFGGSNCGLNHFTSQPFVYKYWILSIPANNLSHVPRLHPIFFKSHIVQYVTESWGGLCSSMQKKSQYTTNKILQNWIKATMYAVVQCPFRDHFTLTACIWSSLIFFCTCGDLFTILIQTNWRLNSHSIQSLISTPPLICSMESVHIIVWEILGMRLILP